MIERLISHLRHRITAAFQSAACAVAAAVAALVAFGFFFAAGFIWLDFTFDTITACLIAGGFFVAVALLALIILAVIRRRNRRPNAVAEVFRDPRLVAAGLEMGRVLRGRHNAPLEVLGAFVVGLLLSRGLPKK